MTNFEWLMTLSEEEFTDWVYDQWLHHLQYRWSSSRGGLMIWLKEERAEQTEPQTEEWYTFQDEQEYNARHGKE